MQYRGELTVVLKYIPAEKNLTLPLDQVQGTVLMLLPECFDNNQIWLHQLMMKITNNIVPLKSSNVGFSSCIQSTIRWLIQP